MSAAPGLAGMARDRRARALHPTPLLPLGMGCASLGSRIGRAAGLRALARAFDLGVRWFDVAPAYGAGEAEAILGEFLRGRRDWAVLVTKVGVAPPRREGSMKLAYALGRPVAGLASGFRRAFRAVSATRNLRLPIDAALVESSIERSLQRLGVECVDLYALHDPDPSAVRRDDVLMALERVVRRGQALAVGVAGGLDACRAALDAGNAYSVLQMDVGDYLADRARFALSGKRVVLHGVFGIGAAYADADRLLERALAINPRGIVLASMFAPRHLAANVATARLGPRPGADRILPASSA